MRHMKKKKSNGEKKIRAMTFSREELFRCFELFFEAINLVLMFDVIYVIREEKVMSHGMCYETKRWKDEDAMR